MLPGRKDMGSDLAVLPVWTPEVPLTGTEHELKTWLGPFDAVWNGYKLHEIRTEVDRHFAVGDILVLRQYDPDRAAYLGCRARVLVTHITRAPFVPAGLCVMSIRLLERSMETG